MAHDEAPTPKLNSDVIEFKNHGTTYTKGLSGALWLSGGALMYTGDTTITQVAAA